MNARLEVRLALAGALTVLAGCHMPETDARPTVIAVGAVMLVVALFREVMTLLAQPSVIRVKGPGPMPAPQRGGLGYRPRQRPLSQVRRKR